MYLAAATPPGWRALAEVLVAAGADPAGAHSQAVAVGKWNVVRCLLTIMLEQEEKEVRKESQQEGNDEEKESEAAGGWRVQVA